MAHITWGLIAEHPDKNLPVNRAPRRGEVLQREKEGPQTITQIVDHEGEVWIILENGEEEEVGEVKPIEVKAQEKRDGPRK